MQNMMFPVANINETLKESFAAFREDPLEEFKVNVRRTRASQLHQLLSNPETIDLATFQNEIWNIEIRTRLRRRNIDFFIFEKKNLLPTIEQLLVQGIITLPDLAQALVSGDLELHGNYVWIQGSYIYGPRIKDEQQKLQHIHDALHILNNATLTPLEKARAIDKVPGFGENNATGLVMLFHPDEFALVNPVSRGTLKKLGVNLTARTPQESIQHELRSLKELLGAQDFLELDWFLYQCSQGKYILTDLEPGTGEGTKKTWLDFIKLVLEEAGEPLHISEITIRVLARGMQTRGSTPERTVSYMLTTHPQVFEKVSDGVYRLREGMPLQESTKVPVVEAQEYTEPVFSDICQAILDQGMHIDEQTLRRYHLALKTRGFVILSGVSGTGKTWLTEAYADAVGAKYLLVPVAPNWTTNEDLLGYVDPLNDSLYHHTSFSFFLEDAAQEHEQAWSEGRRSKPYHLVLDEMNLARVEYYFAKFLSAMEVRARSSATPIDLGAQKVINLYPNLFFIGTINVDETTHGFADKIYDRAQLIELTASRDALKAFIDGELYDDLLMAVWDAVHEVAPFAFRVLDEVKVYVTTARSLGHEWEEALDEQILQKILPKCKGADLRIGDTLKKLEDLLPADIYPLSRAKVQRMLEGFEHYGFASYF
jgi:hypothetical protein